MLDNHTEQFADETEFAMHLAERQTEEAVKRALESSKQVSYKDPEPCGYCHHCGSEVEAGESFCKSALLSIDEIDTDIYKPSAEEIKAGKSILVDECRIEFKKQVERERYRRSIGAHLEID